MVNNEIYIYAKIRGGSIPQPLDIVPIDLHTKEVRKAPISIGERIFYTECSVIKSAEDTALCFGESLTLKFIVRDEHCAVNYRHSKKIRILAKGLDFMLCYFEKGYFKVCNAKIPFDYEGVNLSSFNIESEKRRLDYAKKIVRVLEI